jgi:hypothetical protein
LGCPLHGRPREITGDVNCDTVPGRSHPKHERRDALGLDFTSHPNVDHGMRLRSHHVGARAASDDADVHRRTGLHIRKTVEIADDAGQFVDGASTDLRLYSRMRRATSNRHFESSDSLPRRL